MTDRVRGKLEQAPYLDFDYPRAVRAAPAGGVWAAGAEAFYVEELPLYPFCGEGEHAALRVEKAGAATRELALAVAGRLGVPASAVGYAGMKDKDSVAVQAFTVTGVAEPRAQAAFEAEGCRVLEATRHKNKLRLGHLAGNRFRLFLRGTDPAAAAAVLAELAERGVPNYFGPQRFGARGDNARAGLQLLERGGKMGRWKRDLLVSALQSFVFNEVLARRLEEGVLETALVGDVLRREDSGGVFVCEDVATDAERVARFEVSPTGPVHGKKMVAAGAAVRDREAQVLSELGLAEELFRGETGSRRALRIPLRDASAAEEPGGVRLTFACPPGGYATSVVREVTGAGVRRQ